MKPTVPRPPGPAIAATTAHAPASNHSTGKSDTLPGEEPPTASDNQVTLAVLEQHSLERARGYDPYNASASPMDIQAWRRRQKPGQA